MAKDSWARWLTTILLCGAAAAGAWGYVNGKIPFLSPIFAGAPPTGVGEHPEPLGKPPVIADPDPGYVFSAVQEDGKSPVTWDACRSITYVINPAGMPFGGEKLIHEAARTMSEATGYSIQYEGTTTEQFTKDRAPYQPNLYGERWAPVLISWTSATEANGLAGDVVGRGGAVGIANPSQPEFYVSGRMTLDKDTVAELIRFDANGDTDRAQSVVLHEFAHVMGLDHTPDPNQLMYPAENPFRSGLQPGDLTGLARLNTGACAPWL